MRLQSLPEAGALFLHPRAGIDLAGDAQTNFTDLQYRTDRLGQLDVDHEQIRPPRRPRDVLLQLIAGISPGACGDDGYLSRAGPAPEVQRNAGFRTYFGPLKCLHRRALRVPPRDAG
jgi:hypothetical protein